MVVVTLTREPVVGSEFETVVVAITWAPGSMTPVMQRSFSQTE